MEWITLRNGVKMPQLGFGTINQTGNRSLTTSAFALHHGYGLIDTANRYGNEVEVGRGLKKSGLKREAYFLETKLGPTLYENDGAIDGTLQRLNLDYIVLMLLHHPVNNYIYAYQTPEKAYKEGKLRAIGVSNFPVEKLEELLQNCEIPPMVMQVEAHPCFPAEAVKPFCDAHGIVLQAWFPLGHGSRELLEDPVIVSLAAKPRQDPGPGRPTLAHPDGLRAGAGQPLAGTYPGKRRYLRLLADGGRYGTDRRHQPAHPFL